jgi:chromatin remodeling complex protein RSC6
MTSIVTQPRSLSDALCDFLEVSHGTQMSHADVSKHLFNYIRQNSLRKSGNITPDTKLIALLGLKEEDKLNYLNIHDYLTQHFLNS